MKKERQSTEGWGQNDTDEEEEDEDDVITDCRHCGEMYDGYCPCFQTRKLMSLINRECYYRAEDGPPPEQPPTQPLELEDNKPLALEDGKSPKESKESAKSKGKGKDGKTPKDSKDGKNTPRDAKAAAQDSKSQGKMKSAKRGRSAGTEPESDDDKKSQKSAKTSKSDGGKSAKSQKKGETPTAKSRSASPKGRGRKPSEDDLSLIPAPVSGNQGTVAVGKSKFLENYLLDQEIEANYQGKCSLS